MADVESRMSYVKSRVSDVGSRMSISDVRSRMSNLDCRMSDVECRMFDAGSWMSDVGCRMTPISFRSTTFPHYGCWSHTENGQGAWSKRNINTIMSRDVRTYCKDVSIHRRPKLTLRRKGVM